MFKFNTQKFNTLAVVLAVLTIVYTAPTLSREFITNATQKQVSADYLKQIECLAKNMDQNLRTVCQFSWTCMVKEMVHIHDRYRWEESHLIAKRALTVSVLHDKIAETNALYYHAVYVNPGWNKQKVVTKIGNHIFYSRI